MVWLIIGIIMLVIAVVLFLVASGDDNLSAVPGAIAMFLGFVLILVSCFTVVGTKDVGVVTSFGKPTGKDLTNGLHFKAPWQHVSELDGAIQPDIYEGKNCIPVRIGDSTTACVEGTIRWRIVPNQASILYQDYRSNDVNETIRDSLVKTQFNAALNDVLGKYNPLEQIAAQAQTDQHATITNTAPNLDKFSEAVEASMQQHLKNSSRNGHAQVEVVSITLNFIHLATSTQSKINDYLKEVGATRVAEQREQTTAAQAQANKNLAASVNNDPNVLVSKCFDTVEEAVKQHYQLPAGFSCWPGNNNALVVPSAR